MTLSQPNAADALVDKVVARTAKLTDNTSQEMIITTRDKVELALRRHLPDYMPGGRVVGSLGLSIALVTTLVTAEFQVTLGLSGDVWRGLFVAALLGSVVITLRDFIAWLRRSSIDDLVGAIEKDSRAAEPAE